MRQETLTVLAPVSDEPALQQALQSLGSAQADARGAPHRSIFAHPSAAIHFARLVFIPRDPAAPKTSAWLALESNFDSELADPKRACHDHLEALSTAAHEELRAAFQHCSGFPSDASPAQLAAYCQDHLAAATATYQGHGHRDLPRIGLEDRLRDVVMTFLESFPRKDPRLLYAAIRDHTRSQAQASDALRGLDIDAPPPALPDPHVRRQMLRSPQLEPWALNSGPVWPVLSKVPQILGWDRTDAVYDCRQRQEAWTADDRARFVEIAATEDYGVQNALTHVVPLRPGVGRAQILAHAHRYIDRLSTNYFSYVGQLGGIPTIHFAKWLLIDDGARLLFFSNYDSSWESYLGDFVDQAATGLNLAWSCTQDYPRTQVLAVGGARDEETFKSWARSCQVPTQVFYSAYPHLSVAAINNNTLIRHGLHAGAPVDLDAWFRRLT